MRLGTAEAPVDLGLLTVVPFTPTRFRTDAASLAHGISVMVKFKTPR
jgi:hypothetical protein